MKPRDAALRIQHFEAEEKSRRVRDLELMIREFEQMALDLDRQIEAEEIRTGVRDKGHFAYSTFAKAAALRRDNLKASSNEFRTKLDIAERERDAALERLKQASVAASRSKELRTRRRLERAPLLAAR